MDDLQVRLAALERRARNHHLGLWGAVVALAAFTVAHLPEEPVAEDTPAHAAQPFAGAWVGPIDVSATTLGGMMPVPAHPVQVELVVSQTGDQLAGVGSASNLLGALSALAGVRGALTGEVQGVVLDGRSRIVLSIPPFGAPPAHASVVLDVEATQGQLQGSCWVNLGGHGERPPALRDPGALGPAVTLPPLLRIVAFALESGGELAEFTNWATIWWS